MSKTIEEKVEEVGKLCVDIRSEHEAKTKEYGEKVANHDSSILKMEEKFGELSESIQKEQDDKKSLQEQIKELTLAIARKSGSQNPEEAEMSDEVKDMFGTAVREAKGTYALKPDVMETIISEHVKYSFKHLSADRQDVMIKSILAEGSRPAGGMWCPIPVDTRIRRRVWETTPMRQLASVQTINSGSMAFALDDEDIILAQAGEVDTRQDTNATEFGEVKIETHELYAKPKATLQLLEDSSINLEAWLAGKVSSKITRDQNKAFAVGSGIKEAKGILSYDSADPEIYERGKIGTLETKAALTIDSDDMINLQSHLLEDYQMNATWLMHRLIWAKIVKLKDEEGRYLLNLLTLFSQGAAPTVLGAPVRLAGDFPKPVADALVGGTKYIAYGDFREAYTILDRLGINVIMDNITNSGFVKWYFRTRYGGGVTNFQAVKILKAKA